MAEASHFLHPRDNLVETQFRAILPENSPQVHNAFLTNLLSRYLTEAAERGAAMKEKGGGVFRCFSMGFPQYLSLNPRESAV